MFSMEMENNMDDITLIKFLTVCGGLHQILRNLKIKLSDLKKFKNVQTNCGIYNKTILGDPEVSMGIDSELVSLIEDDLHSVGMSFIVTKKDEKWIFSGEVGWSSYNFGFDEVGSIEKSFDNINMLLDQLEKLVLELIENYKLLIADL